MQQEKLICRKIVAEIKNNYILLFRIMRAACTVALKLHSRGARPEHDIPYYGINNAKIVNSTLFTLYNIESTLYMECDTLTCYTQKSLGQWRSVIDL